MPYTKDSPIAGLPSWPVDINKMISSIVKVPSLDVQMYIETIFKLSPRVGIDPVLLIGQAILETDWFSSGWWKTRRNPAGIGVTGDYDQNSLSQTWDNGRDAAIGHIVHMMAYVYPHTIEEMFDRLGVPQSMLHYDQRVSAPIILKYKAETLDHLGKQDITFGKYKGWADDDPGYGGKIADRANALELRFTLKDNDMPAPAVLDYSSLSFPVTVALIPESQPNQNPGIYMDPKSTTWHDTGNPGRGADRFMHKAFIEGGCRDRYGRPTKTSWHFTVDDEGAVQHIPLNRVAWHAGDGGGPGNYTSIAIEECVNSDRDPTKTRENAIELHAFLRRELGIKVTNQHNYWSNKDCPHTVRSLGLWGVVSKSIEAKANGQTPEPKLPEPRPLPTPVTDAITGNGQIILAITISRALSRDVTPRMWALEGADVVDPGILKKNRLVTVVALAEGVDGKLWAISKEGWRFHADALVQE